MLGLFRFPYISLSNSSREKKRREYELELICSLGSAVSKCTAVRGGCGSENIHRPASVSIHLCSRCFTDESRKQSGFLRSIRPEDLEAQLSNSASYLRSAFRLIDFSFISSVFEFFSFRNDQRIEMGGKMKIDEVDNCNCFDMNMASCGCNTRASVVATA